MNDVTQRTTELLDPDFLRKIERLVLVARKVFAGRLHGERRSSKRGSSVEFADYRDYTHGDDFRRVDWNVYARLERLFLKLFVEEEDLYVCLAIDASKSMDFGSPTKLLYAKRIAAALSYIALCNLDRVSVSVFSDGQAGVMRPARGKQSVSALFDYLQSVSPGKETKLSDSLTDLSLKCSNRGLAVVVSDFLDEDYQRGLLSLLSRGFELVVFHLLDTEEVNPSIVGDLMLIDSEDGRKREVTITQSLLRRYRSAVQRHRSEVESFCTSHGAGYIFVANDTPFEDLILNYLRRRGALR